MVPISTILYLIISAFLSFGFPIILFIWLRKKANKLWFGLLAGMLGFFVMQVMIRMPLMTVLGLVTDLYEVNIFLLAFILAFSAALFETVGRVVTVKIFLKHDHRFSAGIAHGIGHGGIEAIILVGINYVIYIIFALLINGSVFDVQSLAGSNLNQIHSLLVYTQPTMFLLGGIERVLTIVLHIGLSVLVVYAFKIKKKFPIVLVLVIHTLVDFSVVLLSQNGVNASVIELFILVIAVLMYGLIRYIHKQYLQMKVEGELND